MPFLMEQVWGLRFIFSVWLSQWLTMELRQASGLWSSCLSSSSDEITGVHYHTWGDFLLLTNSWMLTAMQMLVGQELFTER